MKETTLQDYKERMLRVLIHIQQRLDDDLPLEELARIAFFSPFHFHRVFRGMIGESVKSHVRRLRLERAAMRLKSSAVSITTIAFDARYEAPEAFTRAFRAMYGESPSEYRSGRNPLSRKPTPSGVHFQEKGSLKNFNPLNSGVETMEVTIKKLEPMRVAFMRHVGPYSECGPTWDRFVPKLGKLGLLGPDTMFLGICYDDPEITPPDKIRYDVCVTVDEDFKPEDDLGVQVIPAGEYAMTTHIGPFEKLGVTWAKLMGEWLPRSGRELRQAPCLEIYLTDPENTDPEDLITAIYAPLTER